jgi:hypothetical protein
MAMCRVGEHLTDPITTGNKKDVRSNKKVSATSDCVDFPDQSGKLHALLSPDSGFAKSTVAVA